MKLYFCLLMSGLCSMMSRASYIVIRLRSWKDFTGRVLFSKSCVWMLVLCFFSMCSLMAPSFWYCSSRLLMVLRVWPMYKGFRSSQSSLGHLINGPF